MENWEKGLRAFTRPPCNSRIPSKIEGYRDLVDLQGKIKVLLKAMVKQPARNLG